MDWISSSEDKTLKKGCAAMCVSHREQPSTVQHSLTYPCSPIESAFHIKKPKTQCSQPLCTFTLTSLFDEAHSPQSRFPFKANPASNSLTLWVAS